MEKYKAKGVINFVFDGFDVVIEEREFNLYEKDLGWDEFDIYDLMTGEKFLEAVDTGCFMDYDGILADVFVDGCVSNLGLCHKDIHQGSFLATKDFWENLMETSKVEVNWANK